MVRSFSASSPTLNLLGFAAVAAAGGDVANVGLAAETGGFAAAAAAATAGDVVVGAAAAAAAVGV